MPIPNAKLRAAGLAIEHRVKQSRWMWRYSHCKQVLDSWIQRQSEREPIDASAPRCLLDLRKIANDGEQGRRFHALVSLLQRGGYQLWMVPHLAFMQTAHRPFKARALDYVFPFDPMQDQQHTVPFDLCLSDARRPSSFAKRTLRVVTSARQPVGPSDLPMPYSFYPAVWENDEDQQFNRYRESMRIWRLFFGGHCSQDAYRKIRKYTRQTLIDRYSVIQEIRRHFHQSTLDITNEEQLNLALSHFHRGFVMIDNAVYRTAAQRWLGLLAQSDFFLAAPGCDYPLSHNAIEAIAVGTIPVLEYPTLFSPPLIGGVNCIAYEGIKGLQRAADEIMSMSDVSIMQMRMAVIDYYENHLSPDAFCRSLQDERYDALHLFPYLTPGTNAVSRAA